LVPPFVAISRQFFEVAPLLTPFSWNYPPGREPPVNHTIKRK